MSSKTDAEVRRELLAEALGDFKKFCRALVWIAPKNGVRTTLRFNPIQIKYVARRTGRDVVLKPRQIGFTTLELARDVWKFVTVPGARVVVLCQSATGNGPMKKLSADIRRMFEGLRLAGLDLPFGTDSGALWTLPDRDASLTLVESGASEAAAQKKGRAGTYTRVHATELAFWEHPELTLNALLEGVPSGADTEVVFESTPNGVGNWFHGQYVGAASGATGYRAHFFPWFDDPTYRTPLLADEIVTPQNDREAELVNVHGISSEQLKWYRLKVASKGGQDLVDQEYPSDPIRCFLTSGRLYFDAQAIERLGAQVREPIEMDERGGIRVWRRPEAHTDYLISVDPAEGLGEDGDWTYGVVLERRTQRHVASFRTQLREHPAAVAVAKLAARFNDATIAVERNKGMALIGALEGIDPQRHGVKRPTVYYDQDDKPGFATTTSSRPVILEDLANVIREGTFHTDDEVLLTELRAFVIDHRTGRGYSPSKNKKNGTSDDGIMATAIGVHLCLRGAGAGDAADTGGDDEYGFGDSLGRGF